MTPKTENLQAIDDDFDLPLLVLTLLYERFPDSLGPQRFFEGRPWTLSHRSTMLSLTAVELVGNKGGGMNVSVILIPAPASGKISDRSTPPAKIPNACGAKIELYKNVAQLVMQLRQYCKISDGFLDP